MYLGFSISYSVTQEEWEKVYEESLFLAQQLNLADWERFYYKGVRSYAYCKVKEQTDKRFSKQEHFWLTCGEYDHITNGDYFRMKKELNIYKYNEKAGPGIIIAIDSNKNSMSDQFEDQVRSHGLTILDYAYFIRLLAILCFMESKLKEKIYIYGNITKRSCEVAVKFANQYLKKKIELPAQCDCNRLYEIVKKLEIPDYKKIHLMEKAYAGEIDLKYKKFIEEKIDKKAIKESWKNRFKDHVVGDYEFEKILKSYLSYGFDFKDLFSYVKFTNEKEEYLKFLELIIEIENNKSDWSKFLGLTRDPKDNKVRGFSLEFRHSLFGSNTSDFFACHTFDEYVNELSKYFGEQIDVKSFLKEKIKDEDEDSLILRVKKHCNEDNYDLFEGEEKFDIIFANELIHYKPGDKIAPYLMKEIKAAVKSNRKRLADKEFKEIQEKEPTEQIYELIDIYSHFPVRDIDWHHAIDYFNSHSDALKRYYPLFRMNFDYFLSDRNIAKALFINDDFYEFCGGIK
jgi:hypothetical protein